MSLIAQVMQVAQTTRADVIRVLSHGGTTAQDWAIAHAIQTVTGRSAAETMWAGRARQANPEQATQTNPRAVHDPTVTIYPENTSPEDSNRIAPHHPSNHEDDTVEDTEDTEDTEDVDDDQAERVAAQNLADQLFSDLAEVLDNPGAAHRLTRAWTTPAEGRQILTQVLEIHANTHLRTEIAVRTIEADLAA
jgi:hypothetical protein